MKTESTIKPEIKFSIENIKDNTCEVVFFDNISEETKEEQTVYVYYTYRMKTAYRTNLDIIIEQNYNKWLEAVKNHDYNLKAEEIRNKRNQLLADSDKNMVLDRIDFEIPKEITLTNIVTVIKELFNTISTIKNGAWAVYRQELRDITKQKGFPYEVEFPKKPE